MNQQAVNHLGWEVRQRSLPRVLLMLGILGCLLVMVDEKAPPSLSSAGILLVCLVLPLWFLRKAKHTAAVLSLCAGLLALTVVVSGWYPEMRPHYALLIPVVIANMALGRRATVGLAIVVGIIVALLGISSARALGSLAADGLGLWVIVFLLTVSSGLQREVAVWAWHSHEQAQAALGEARGRQVELKQALADLALTTSETVRLNEMLVAARKAVDDARRAKEEFVANVSHELRTPLNMIIGFSDMILESPEVYSPQLPPSLLADVAAIKRNSQHLASLVDDVLDLSESELGYTQLDKEWTSIREIAQEAAQAVEALFQKKGLYLRLKVPDDIPPVYCDRTRIRQVILNLLSNAGRFTEKGGCELGVELVNDLLTVGVADTGPGMTPDTLGNMFEPFQQGDPSLRRRYGGTGLGLAISKRFVELHGGKIWLQSQIGVGTAACFTLPVSDREVLVNGQGPHTRWFGPYQEYAVRPGVSMAPKVESTHRLVVLEQGDALATLIARHLGNAELVRVACLEDTGPAVVESAARAVLVNEASLLEPSAASSWTGRMGLDVPVIRCWIPDRQTTLLQMGAQDYLVKPIDRSDLLQSVRRTAPQAGTILLVDDDSEARQLFRRMLASADEDYIVLQAEDGTIALEVMRERHPDVVLLDLIMPNMDGFAVLEAMSSDVAIRDIPVVIISAKDPQREPIVSKTLSVTRQTGLSARDLASCVGSITQALEPRFVASAQT